MLGRSRVKHHRKLLVLLDIKSRKMHIYIWSSWLSEVYVYTGGFLPSLVAFKIRAFSVLCRDTIFSLHQHESNPNSTSFQPSVFVNWRFLMEHRCCLLHANLPSLESQGDSLISWSYLETAGSPDICQCQQKATILESKFLWTNLKEIVMDLTVTFSQDY